MDKDLKILDEMTKSKDNDKGSRSKITKHEGTSLQHRQRQPQELNDKIILNELTKECHSELTSGEIVSLKILSRTMNNRPCHLVKDCRGVPSYMNPDNARNPTGRACYECRNIDHVRPACPRLNREQGPGGNRPNQVVANNEGQGHGNQENQAR
nr:hypothetical protein [Tanacetum cinerariifolium]